MADVLRIRRRAAGGSAAAPASLFASELAYNEQTDILYYGRGNSGGVATAVVPIAGPGAFLPLIGGSVSGGIDFGSAVAPGGPADLSRHIALFGTTFGFSITSGRLNYVVPGANAHVFLAGAADKVTINASGLTMASGTAITLAADPTSALQAVTKQYVDAAGVTSFNTRTGAITLTNADVTGVLLPSSTNPVMDGTVAIGTSGTWARADHVHPIDTSRAPLASPTFTGTPAAPTPAIGDESTTLATTLFVARNAAGYVPTNIGDADATWTTAQANARIINASGALTADRTVTLPVNATNKAWVVRNGTTGGFNVIFAAGTNSYSIPQGYAGEIWSSGAALFPAQSILPASTVRFGDATRNAVVITTGVYPAGITTIATTGTGILQFNTGIGFGNVVASSTSDLSAHLALYSTNYGFNVTSGRLNIVSGGGIWFNSVGVDKVVISSLGLTMQSGTAITLAADPTTALQAATKQYVDAASAANLPLIGGTVTGTTSFGTNTTSVMVIFNGPSGSQRYISFRTANVNRWIIGGNTTPETGTGNVGTDFGVYRYADDGSFLGAALVFARSSGLGLLAADPTSPLGIATKQYVDAAGVTSFNTRTGAISLTAADVSGASGLLTTGNQVVTGPFTIGSNTVAAALNLNGPTGSNIRDVYWQTAGVSRWRLHPNNSAESGANAGCDLDLLAYDDSGVAIGTYVARITRSTGLITIGNGGLSFGSVVAPGGVTDLSRHIALFGTTIGFGVTSGRLNIVSTTTVFVSGGTDVATFNSSGITANTVLQAIGTENNALASTTFVARNAGGFISTALADADATWTSTQLNARIINVTGALTADRTITVPTTSQQRNWIVRNGTTGGFNVIVTSGGTQTYSIPPACQTEFWCNSVNLFPTHNLLVAAPLRIGDATRNALIITPGALTNPCTIGLGGTGALQFLVSPIAPTPATADNSTSLATTAFVKAQAYAPLASPTFTGVPAAPTAAPGTSTTQLATTAFVQAAASAAGVQTFNTRSGAVTLTNADVTGVLLPSSTNPLMNGTVAIGTSGTWARADHVHPIDTSRAPLASPTFTGVPAGPTAAPGTNTTQFATTAFVTAADIAAAGVTLFNTRSGAITLIAADVTAAGGALLASPAFTGTPTAPTATAGTSTTQLATTAFVQAAAAAAGVQTFNTRSGAVTLLLADVTGAGGAPLASPTFTGTPAAPTATAGTSTTQLATTAFVTTAFGSYAPLNAPILTGAVQITGAGSQLAIVGGASSLLNMMKTVSGQANVIAGYTGTVNQRWALNLGNTTAESGSNAGSDLSIVRYADNGTSLGTAFLIARASGNATVTGNFLATGTVSGNGAYINTSDRRLKQDIADTELGLTEIMRLRPVSFRRKRMTAIEFGFIAQELRDVIPAAVGPTDDSDDPMLGIMLDPIVAALVNGMKALAARVQHLEGRTIH